MKLTLPAESAMRSPDFIFGVATSAYQIEGGAAQRLPCIRDTFCAIPGKIRDRSDGRVACDHIARCNEDVDLMAELGVDAYRFSVSWPRVLRMDGSLNDKGISFYLRLLDRLNERNIIPFVTLYHWDLPQHLEDAGGWLCRDTAFRFRDYADAVTRALGDRVHAWVTLNEPQCSAYLGYETGIHAPGHVDPAFGKRAAHHLLLGHGLAMEVLNANSPGTMNGIVLNLSPCHPASESPEDREAAGLADEACNRWYLEPVLAGRYPDLLGRLSPGEAPPVEEGDLELIGCPVDFLGVNHYTRHRVRAEGCGSFAMVEPESVPMTDMGWEVYPQGLTELLETLDTEYDLPPVYITENGAAMSDRMEGGQVHDLERTRFIQDHLSAVDAAMRQGVDVRGYFCWSLMDNFEWAEGYVKRFGIVHVDYRTQRRTVKASGRAYRELLSRRVRAQRPDSGP